MAQALMRYKDSAGVWHDIPFRPTAAVLSVNGKNGIVDLAESDIPNLVSDLSSKLVKPATAGTLDQVLASDGAGNTKWITLGPTGVVSVNGKTGVVTLDASDVNAYSKSEMDTALAAKANSADVYTKAETYSKTEAYSKAETYSQTQTNALLDGKVTAPTIVGSVGQVLTLGTGGTTKWASIPEAPVTSVNTKTGAVVLKAADINMNDGKTVEETLNGKFNKPTGSASAHRVITSDGAGGAYWYDAVNRVNGKYGYVELKGSDIKVSTSDTRTIAVAFTDCVKGSDVATVGYIPTKTATGYTWASAPVASVNGKTGGAVILDSADINVHGKSQTLDDAIAESLNGVLINSVPLTITDRKVNIPLAGVPTSNAAGGYGVVRLNSANGITVDANGEVMFTTNALAALNGARKEITAEEYDMEKMYQVGQYVQHMGRYYVCKTSNSTGVFTLANFSETSVSAERNNMLEQLIAALGIKENPRRWDSINKKILYDFVLDN